jgi:hypothetical protein
VIAGASPRPWTEKDDNELRTMAVAGAGSRAIGMRMNRTGAAVRTRAAKLKIILRKRKLISRTQQGAR